MISKVFSSKFKILELLCKIKTNIGNFQIFDIKIVIVFERYFQFREQVVLSLAKDGDFEVFRVCK